MLMGRDVGLCAQLEGTPIMLAAILHIRLRLDGEDHREGEMRVGAVGFQSGGGFEFLLRGLRPALLARSDAEIVVRDGVFGIDRDRLRQFADRLIKFPLAGINDAQRAGQKAISVCDFDGAFEGQAAMPEKRPAVYTLLKVPPEAAMQAESG